MCDIYIMRYGWEWKNHNNHMEFKIYLFIDSKWFDSAFYAYAVEKLSSKKNVRNFVIYGNFLYEFLPIKSTNKYSTSSCK